MKKSELIRELEAIPGDPEVVFDCRWLDEMEEIISITSDHPCLLVLNGAITIDKGAVEQANFPDYEVIRLADCPQIEITIVESDAAMGGAGEPGVPPIAPAVTNAIFAATGTRIRELPVRLAALGTQKKAANL